MDGGKSEGRTKYYIVSINRHGIHASGVEIDVESAVVEAALAEKPPDQFEFGGGEPLIHEQLLNGKRFGKGTAWEILFLDFCVNQSRQFHVGIRKLLTAIADDDLPAGGENASVKDVWTVLFRERLKDFFP